jgi:dynein regulatory complex subunit 2
LEDKQQLRVNLELKINETFDQFKLTMKNYEELNEDRQRQFFDLKEKDEKSAKDIDKQMKIIQTLNVIRICYVKSRLS